MTWKEVQDWSMRYGHYPILAGLAWVMVALHRNGIRMTIDIGLWKKGRKIFSLWKNGKH